MTGTTVLVGREGMAPLELVVPGPFGSVAEIRAANTRLGHHWFEPASMRFFNSTVGRVVYGGRFFVSSECREPGETPRRYSVRVARDDGSVETVGEFMAYPTGADAVAAIRWLLN